MITRLVEYFDVVATHAPEGLLDREQYAELRRVASVVPASPLAGFERPLGGAGAGTDFALHVEPGDPCATAIVDEVGRGVLSGAAWRSVAALLEPAATEHAEGAVGFENLWLEVDASAGRTEPVVFVTPEGIITAAALAEQVWRRTGGPALDARTRRALDRLDALPGRVRHLARLLPRPEDPVRICLVGVGPAEMAGILEAFGHRPSPLRTAAGLTFARHPVRMTFAIDVDESGVRPRVGIECAPVGPTTDRDDWWRGALQALVDDGLCHPAERDDLLAWCGQSAAGGAERWPDGLGRIQTGALAAEPVFVRGLHHLKLGFADGGVVAKVYYGYVLAWHPRDAVAEAHAAF